MKKRKHIRKIISLLLVMALMSTCLGLGSASADDPPITGAKRSVCIAGPAGEEGTNPSSHINSALAMNEAFYHIGAPATIPAGVTNYPYYNSNLFDDIEDTAIPQILAAFPHGDDPNATEKNVNYVYLCGHGSTSGINLGGSLSYARLRQVLDGIPGHFIIFINACHSGSAINRGNNQSDRDDANVSSDVYAQEILKCFLGTNRSGELTNSSKYTVFCACQASEFAWGWNDPDPYNGNRHFTWATYAWAKGLGFEMRSNGLGGYYYDDYFADANSDGIVTAKELNDYITEVYEEEFNPILISHGLDLATACYYSMYYFRTIAAQDYPLGNPYMDGEISIRDVWLIRDYLEGTGSLTLRQKELANVNGTYSLSGYPTITEGDVWMIEKYLAGIPLT